MNDSGNESTESDSSEALSALTKAVRGGESVETVRSVLDTLPPRTGGEELHRVANFAISTRADLNVILSLIEHDPAIARIQ